MDAKKRKYHLIKVDKVVKEIIDIDDPGWDSSEVRKKVIKLKGINVHRDYITDWNKMLIEMKTVFIRND